MVIVLMGVSGSGKTTVGRKLAADLGFMDPEMLRSQIDAMEPPVGEVAVDAAPPPDQIAADIRRELDL